MHKPIVGVRAGEPMRAAIDIGSNTLHLVVARAISLANDLEIVEDKVDMVRIGESVTATGEISPQKRETALAVLRNYQALAQQHGAEQILVVATEAIRQASNGADFLEEIRRETGLETHLISGTVEAELTFLGATYETAREANAPAQLGVIDLGGGSMELVTAKQMQITWRTSMPIGSGWLHDRYLPSNPPTYDELSVAYTFLQTYFRGMRVKYKPPVLIVTGGSANSLLLLARRAFGLDTRSYRLTFADLVHCEGILSALSAEEISQRYEQPLDRARILPAGALIMRVAMTRLGLQEMRVSPHGIREGVLLAYARYGDRWLKQAEKRGSGKRSVSKQATRQAELAEAGEQEESFGQSARRILPERMKKMLEWRDEVLKQEDIEAVHKMRVASRRLRAALDAYESCCQPKQFKKIYHTIKELADLLGQVRDMDVLLQNLQIQDEQAMAEEEAGLQWLIDRLKTYRQSRQTALVVHLQDLDEDELEQQIRSSVSEGVASHGKS